MATCFKGENLGLVNFGSVQGSFLLNFKKSQKKTWRLALLIYLYCFCLIFNRSESENSREMNIELLGMGM